MTTAQKSISRAAILVAFAACASPAPAAPEAIVKASCALPKAEATMLTANPAEWPTIALETGASGTAVVKIDLVGSGIPRNAVIVESTGNTMLDEAAKGATLHQNYSPEIRDCAKVGGSYLVRVDFQR